MKRESENALALQRPATCFAEANKSVHYSRSDRNFDHYIVYDVDARHSLGSFPVRHHDFLQAEDKAHFVRLAARRFLSGYEATSAVENARIVSLALRAA